MIFPFDQPAPTAFYLVLYIATLVLHVAPMNYVLAGSTYLALLGAWEAVTGNVAESHKAIADKLRDWMPLALSITITAGVAPLLFIQILYKEAFYTANLLLFHRWMAILPVLILAFYLLYLQKLERLTQGRPRLRLLFSAGVLFCFAFVAWSWTENHLLSTQGEDVWVEQYASESLFYVSGELLPRLALWYLGGFPTLGLILAWQLRQSPQASRSAKTLALIALSTLVAATVAALTYAGVLPGEVRTEILRVGWLYLTLAGVGGVLQAGCWVQIGRRSAFSSAILMAATAGAIVSTLGITIVREIRRAVAIDLTTLYEAHAQASRVGGLAVFLFFLILNTLLIAGVIAMVRLGARSPLGDKGPTAR